MIRIATFNVNSIKAHIVNVTGWLKAAKPDVVLMQEIKCTDDGFPRLEIEDLGYNVATVGQKTYNGVAILSKHPLTVEQKALPGNRRRRSRALHRRAHRGVQRARTASASLCASPRSICPTAIRQALRNSPTSWPGWSACAPMQQSY